MDRPSVPQDKKSRIEQQDFSPNETHTIWWKVEQMRRQFEKTGKVDKSKAKRHLAFLFGLNRTPWKRRTREEIEADAKRQGGLPRYLRRERKA